MSRTYQALLSENVSATLNTRPSLDNPNTLILTIVMTYPFGSEYISGAWLRLNKDQVRDLISDFDKYLSGSLINRKCYSMRYEDGRASYISIEVSKYTKNLLEINIANESTFCKSMIREAFIRIEKSEAVCIREDLAEFLNS